MPRSATIGLVVGILALLWSCTPPSGESSVGDGPDEDPSGSDPPGEVRLVLEPAPPTVGDTVSLVLTNGSPGPIGYNLCTSQLEVREGSAWDARPSDRMCTMELRTLPPGDEARFPVVLPEPGAAAVYRFRTTVTRLDDDTRTDVLSEPFDLGGVRAGPSD